MARKHSELQNIVERALILSRDGHLRFPNLGPGAQLSVSHYPARKAEPVLTMDQAIANHIRLVLEQVGGRVKGKGGAAKLLNMNPSTLLFRMKKLGIKTKRSELRTRIEAGSRGERVGSALDSA